MDLSIIIPVYNGEKYLKDCLESIIQAKNKKIEIIIINDGSTDKTLKICKEYKEKDKRIKLINNTNHGVSYSRNNGINVSNGKYVMFVDADDILVENWFNHISNLIDKNIDYVIFSKKIKNLNLTKEEILDLIIGTNKQKICLAGPFSKIFKREILLKNNIYFNEKIINGEDMLFNTKVLLQSKTVLIKKESFYRYRITSQSVTHNFKETLLNSDMHFHQDLFETINTKISKQQQEKICNFCYTNSILMFSSRISNLNSFKEAKQYFFKIKKRKKYKVSINIIPSLKEKIIIILFQLHLYYPIYILYNSYSKKIKRKFEDHFITI